MIAAHIPMVKRIALGMVRGKPSSVELDDLIGSGMLGLVEAAESFNGRGEFGAWAYHRIKGAMLDDLRKLDPMPRELRRLVTKAARLYGTDTEKARALGVPLADYQKAMADATGYAVVPTEDLQKSGLENYVDHSYADSRPEPLQALLDCEQSDEVQRAISHLRPNDRTVIELYYGQAMGQKAIGELMGLSEVRVSQIRLAAIARLRRVLK